MLVSGGASAVTYDYRVFGPRTALSYQECGTNSSDLAGTAQLRIDTTVGLGHLGLGNQFSVEGGETVALTFNEEQPGVSITLVTMTDFNMNGTNGEVSIRAYDIEGMLIGSASISETSVIDVSAIAGGAGVQSIDLNATDAVSIGSITFDTLPGQVLGSRFDRVGTRTASSFQFCGLTLTGTRAMMPADLSVSISGLSVVGGTSGFMEPTEVLQVTFDHLGDSVVFEAFELNDLNGNQIFGEAIVRAWDENDQPLQAQMISGLGTKDLTTLFGGGLLSAFEVEPIDRFRVRRVNHSPVPEPAAGLLSLGTLGCLVALRRGRRLASSANAQVTPPGPI